MSNQTTAFRRTGSRSRRDTRLFRILLVGSDNTCRSAAAERMLARLLVVSRDSPFELGSAGVAGVPGRPLDPSTAACLHRRGVAVDGHLSRRLERPDVAAADLVLTVDRSHRPGVTGLDVEAVWRTFTIAEFARLAPAATRAGVIDARELVAAAAAVRGELTSPDPSREDLPEPVEGDEQDHERVLELLQPAVTGIATALLAAARPGVPVRHTGRRVARR